MRLDGEENLMTPSDAVQPPSTRKRSATIREVAEAAGVGLGTVSRVFSGSGPVSASSRERVLTAAKDLGYRRSALARGLKRQTTDNLGLVIADIGNHFYSQLAKTVIARAKAADRHVIVCATDENPVVERDYLDLLIQQRVDGIIAVPTPDNAESWRDAQRFGTNVVFFDRTVEGLDVPSVHADNVGGSCAATTYLIEQGHRRIAFLGGPSTVSTGSEREAGFRLAHERSGLAVDERLVMRSAYLREVALESALDLLRSSTDATALFAANNVLGEAALTALRQVGRRVPDDMSVVMFDDVPWAEITTPTITVVAQRIEEMADAATALAVHPRPERGPRTRTATDLIIRESVRALAP
jgi:LacI family transcriptional regulator